MTFTSRLMDVFGLWEEHGNSTVNGRAGSKQKCLHPGFGEVLLFFFTSIQEFEKLIFLGIFYSGNKRQVLIQTTDVSGPPGQRENTRNTAEGFSFLFVITDILNRPPQEDGRIGINSSVSFFNHHFPNILFCFCRSVIPFWNLANPSTDNNLK